MNIDPTTNTNMLNSKSLFLLFQEFYYGILPTINKYIDCLWKIFNIYKVSMEFNVKVLYVVSIKVVFIMLNFHC